MGANAGVVAAILSVDIDEKQSANASSTTGGKEPRYSTSLHDLQ